MIAGPVFESTAAQDLVLRIAEVAALADQCEGEGNAATAVALRRVAQALWGEAVRRRRSRLAR